MIGKQFRKKFPLFIHLASHIRNMQRVPNICRNIDGNIDAMNIVENKIVVNTVKKNKAENMDRT